MGCGVVVLFWNRDGGGGGVFFLAVDSRPRIDCPRMKTFVSRRGNTRFSAVK